MGMLWLSELFSLDSKSNMIQMEKWEPSPIGSQIASVSIWMTVLGMLSYQLVHNRHMHIACKPKW